MLNTVYIYTLHKTYRQLRNAPCLAAHFGELPIEEDHQYLDHRVILLSRELLFLVFQTLLCLS
jgi:hypothetical protein